jgi:hypothetical protein
MRDMFHAALISSKCDARSPMRDAKVPGRRLSSIRVVQTSSNQRSAVDRQLLLIRIAKFRIVLTPPQNRHLMLGGRRAGDVKWK